MAEVEELFCVVFSNKNHRKHQTLEKTSLCFRLSVDKRTDFLFFFSPPVEAWWLGPWLWPRHIRTVMGRHGNRCSQVPHRLQREPDQHQGAGSPHCPGRQGAGPGERPGACWESNESAVFWSEVSFTCLQCSTFVFKSSSFNIKHATFWPVWYLIQLKYLLITYFLLLLTCLLLTILILLYLLFSLLTTFLHTADIWLII